MALENLVGADKFLSALVPANPVGADDKREGDDHIRGIKNALKNTFPNINGAVTATEADLSAASGGAIAGKVSKAGDTMTGNLGVGMAPSAWAIAFKALQVKSAAVASDGTAGFFLTNAFLNGSGNYELINAGGAAAYLQTGSAHTWYGAAAGAAGAVAGLVPRMGIDAAGLINISDPGINERGVLNVAATQITKAYSATGDVALDTIADSTASNSQTGGGLCIIRGANGNSGVAFSRIYAYVTTVPGGATAATLVLIGSAGSAGETFVASLVGNRFRITAAGTQGGAWHASFICV